MLPIHRVGGGSRLQKKNGVGWDSKSDNITLFAFFVEFFPNVKIEMYYFSYFSNKYNYFT